MATVQPGSVPDSDPKMTTSTNVAEVGEEEERQIIRDPATVEFEDVEPSEFTPSDFIDPYQKPNYHRDYLEAAEHRAVARSLKISDIHGRKVESDRALGYVGKKKVELDFGKIIALAGDFYTNRESRGVYFPVVDCEGFGSSADSSSKLTTYQRFENAVTSLIEDKDGFLFDIQKLLDEEHGAVTTAEERGDDVAQVYHQHKHYTDNCRIPDDEEMAKATGGIIFGKVTPMFFLYAWVAYTNIDHFGDDAVAAYCVGHTMALRKAREASKLTDEAAKIKALNEAYIREAFSAHYLTDLFSSGHMRSPRRALHTPSVSLMNVAGLKGYPIWDFQNRFMHDDDSATGLIVRNKKGHQWIEYGDKQFFEPQGCVNRSRSMHCLQLSMDEVFDIGFKGQQDIPQDWKANSTWFAAMEYLPQPMTAVAETTPEWLKEWGGYDLHNPAPLWIAPSPKPYVEDGWTIRKDLNDHSNFGARSKGTPANKAYTPFANAECTAIKAAPFCGDDQFPLTLAMNGLLSGGFMQIQDLPAPDVTKGTCINFWSPANVEIAGTNFDTFTLRNRLIDEDFDVAGPANKRVEWMYWSRDSNQQASVEGFAWISNNAGTADIKFVSQAYNRLDWRSKADVDGTRVSFDVDASWALTRSMGLIPVTISSGLPADVQVRNLTRFVKGKFISEEEGGSMDHVAVSLLPAKQAAQIAIHSFALSDGDDASDKVPTAQTMVNLKGGSVYGFSKKYHAASSNKDSLLLARAASSNGKMTVDFAKIDFDAKGAASKKDYAFEFSAKPTLQDANVLVGDVCGIGSDQAVVMSGDLTNVNLAVYGHSPSSSTDIELCGTHKCNMNASNPITRPFLTALVASCTSNPGLDVLQITQHRKGNSCYLVFRTHCRSDAAPGQGAEIFANCKETDMWLDPLASNTQGRYFNLKWMPVTYSDPKDETKTFRGLLEVFSWYGVLGVRLFGAGSSGWKYSLVGQLPYLGQTSIGAGLGCDGNWGHGFVTWNQENEWVDANCFRPVDPKNLAVGFWGMDKEEAKNRQLVRGWEVEKRPLL